MEAVNTSELTEFFKALADPTRLKIIGLLAQQSLSVEQIGEMLGLKPSTISHHLGRLSKVGLVSARAEGYYSIYRLETKPLEEMSRRMLSQENLPQVAANVDLDAYDRKVLKSYTTSDGRVRELPIQRKKIEVILRYVVESFEPGIRYTEKQVNEILSRYNEDTAWLRRQLVDLHFMDRLSDGAEYWLA